MNIQNYVDDAHQTALKHGWHDEKKSMDHFLMLIITEMAELIQADRRGIHARREMFEYRLAVEPNDPDERFKKWFDTFIKQSFEDELADICIRVFDFIGEFNISIDQLNRIHSDIRPEFFNLSLTEQCYFMISSIVECDSMPINCKLILLTVENMAKWNDIDLEWYIEQKMRYNRLREWKHGNKKY